MGDKKKFWNGVVTGGKRGIEVGKEEMTEEGKSIFVLV